MKKLCVLMLILLRVNSYAQVKEPVDPKKQQADQTAWQHLIQEINFHFVDSDFSLSKHNVPDAKDIHKQWNATAWRGETINTQLALWTKDSKFDQSTITLVVSDLKSKRHSIAHNHMQLTPVAYVISDYPSQLKSGCGINVILDSTLVADRITNSSTTTFQSHEVRPLWLR